ncbi:hypothetical protein [Curtobacterium sp. P97]|jgi:predicted outer membrane protein|uniref:hypothetical protein n=1 Tax=Curtobacterium sp. P97 TaxID=2939562 RepID=UPI0020416575|nr:hypothetical protein [Curtobacterium sp. P97]MCM3522821.1 hypothetical protein [Curtobacterium sp. P97]
MSRKTIAVATAALAVALLAGCSNGGSGNGGAEGSGSSTSAASSAPSSAAPQAASQSKAEACNAFQSKVEDAAKGLQSQVTELQSDPQAAVAKLEEFDQSLSDGVDAVQNADVKPKAEAFRSAYTDMLTQIKAITADPQSADLSAFSDTTQKVQDAGTDFQQACTS